MKTLIVLAVLGMSLSLWAQAVMRSGVPRLVRTQKITEVFFMDLKDSYWIDQDSSHNSLMSAFLKGAKERKSVSFMADEKTRRILKVGDQVEKPAQDKKSNFTDGEK